MRTKLIFLPRTHVFATLVCATVALLPAAAARADTVELNGGTRLEGVVLSPVSADQPAPVTLLLPSGDQLVLAADDIKTVTVGPDAPVPGAYLRFAEPSETDAGGLDVAITSFVGSDGGARIDLVSAVHVADPGYFRKIQRVLEAADVVLYEGVKPKDATPAEFQKASAEGSNPIRDLQTKFAEWFDLAFQLDAIEYGRPHFVHADLTAEEMSSEGVLPGSGVDQGPERDAPEDAEAKPAAAPAAAPGVDLIAMVEKLTPMLTMMLKDPAARARFKTMFARTLGTANVSAMLGTMMPQLAEVLLDKRNDVVGKRLREWAPKAETSVAVFYGAAHMKDLERMLVEDLSYRRAGSRWIRAWDLSR